MSSALRPSSLMEAVDDYMKMFLRFAALFLQGLTLPRSQHFMSVSCLRDTASTKQPHTFYGGKVVLTELIVDYLVTQVFPLEQVYDSVQLVDTSTFYIEGDVLYFQEFAGQLPFAQCQPNTKDLISPGGQKSIHRLRSSLVSYLTTQQNLHGITTKDNVLLRLRNLASLHQPVVGSMTSLVNSNFPELVKVMVWYLSAYADWFDVEFCEPADVAAACNLLLTNIIFPLRIENLVKTRESFVVDLLTHKEYARQLDPAKVEEIYDELYVVLTNNDLYISEPALRNLTILVINVLNNDTLVAKILQVGGYCVKLQL
jgi:hypothetical protein